MAPAPKVGFVLLGFLAAAILLNGSRIHGSVTDGQDVPLAGAYVWLADSAGIQLRLRTDAKGRFHIWHRPFAYSRGALLVCAPRHSALVSSRVPRALVNEFGLGRLPPNTPFAARLPAEWTHDVPDECELRARPS